MRDEKRPVFSVIIKALNEERHIAGAIESALAALADLDGEVILADGASTDRTVAIAQNYPIKIVRLDHPDDRSCGAGAQLGYQYSRGEFICLMDGDMRLHPSFLAAGARFLRANPGCGGVGGAVVDLEVENLEYQQRAERHDPDREPGLVMRLNGSGLYRRSAIESVGYSTDRNLHGGEELELAARLKTRGWTLARINAPAVDHYVHGGNAFRLLLRRMRTRNAFGPGEIVRASIGRPHFGFILRTDRNVLLCGLVAGWWCSLWAVALLSNGRPEITGLAALAIIPLAIMWLRWRSLRNALYSVAVWNAFTLCFLPGFFRPRKPPAQWIASTVVKELQPVDRSRAETDGAQPTHRVAADALASGA